MQLTDLGLGGVQLISPERHEDSRGWFAETFNSTKFSGIGLPASFAQDNQSFSRGGVLRGLHFQHRQPQGKLVRVISGKIWDVAVDLRQNSPTLGQHVSVELNARNAGGGIDMLWIPEGFAHGFLVLSPSAEVLYKVTRPYDPGGEHTVLWNDPQLAIPWPLDRLPQPHPLVSAKDAAGIRFADAPLF